MARISKYQTVSGETLYRVRFYTPDRGETQKRGFRTRRDAEAFASSVEVSKLKGEYVSPANARVTVGELGPAWLDRQRGHLKPAGYVTIEATWRLRVQPRWGNIALGDIRPTAVQQWVSDLGRGTSNSKPVGASVIRRTHYIFSSILADAVRDNLIGRNPAADVKLPTTTRKRPVYLTHEQVGALAAAAGEYEGLVLFLAYTGLRRGEAIGLHVRDLNMLRKRATISENAVQSGSQIFVGTPKSHKQRTVPLPEFLLSYLGRQCEGRGRHRLGGAAIDAARPSAHRSEPRGVGRGERQSGPEDARPCQRSNDVGHLRRPFRRRS
jgi:hypothetical protein